MRIPSLPLCKLVALSSSISVATSFVLSPNLILSNSGLPNLTNIETPTANSTTNANLTAADRFVVTPEYWSRMYGSNYLTYQKKVYRIENSQILGPRQGYDPPPVDTPAKLGQFQASAIDDEGEEQSTKSDRYDPFDIDIAPWWSRWVKSGWKPEASSMPKFPPWPPTIDIFEADGLAKAAGYKGVYQVVKYEMVGYPTTRSGEKVYWPCFWFFGATRGTSWLVRTDTKEAMDPPWQPKVSTSR